MVVTTLDSPMKIFGSTDFSSSTFDFTVANTMTPDELFQGTPSVADSEELGHDKPTKKRRSWGQQLPTPTTNLPPRKRAKTEAEKEQRRIERVIRNRLAAHSSRERKRKEVESLEEEKSVVEDENSKLRRELVALTTKNAALTQQVKELQAELGRPVEAAIKEEPLSFPPSPPPEESIQLVSSPAFAALATSKDLTQHPAVSVIENCKMPTNCEAMSRCGSATSTALTTASTCLSSPLSNDNFDDLFGTACETPTCLTEFDTTFVVDPELKNIPTNPFGSDMFNFDADLSKNFVNEFVNMDEQKDTYYQDHFYLFSNEVPV